MTRRVFPALVLVGLLAGPAWAHKVNVYAVAQAGAVTGEGYFSGGAKAQDAEVEVHDASGAVIAQGRTATDGTFTIGLPKNPAAPLTIVLKAGEGHRNDFTLTAQDMAQAGGADAAGISASPANPPGRSTETPPASDVPGGSAGQAGSAPALASTDEARFQTLVEAAVAKAVEEKLVPLRLELAKISEQSRASKVRDIVAGIGWIVGLVGIAAWFKRPRG